MNTKKIDLKLEKSRNETFEVMRLREVPNHGSQN